MADAKKRNKVRIMNGGKVGGYTKKDIIKVKKDGKTSFKWKAKHSNGKKNKWAMSLKKAYAELKEEGVIADGQFVPLNSKGVGEVLYARTKEIHEM
jgi:hypothetical protein